MSFDTFNFHPKIQAALKSQGFETPTPIQTQSIPLVLAGKDLLGLAQTGTGKTAAFVLPILQKLSSTKAKHIKAVVIAPTRELAQQIHEVFCSFGKTLGIRSMTAFGGVSFFRQAQEIRRGVDVVVACPGRLLDHIQERSINLSHIEMLVLDEADQMFDMGFIPTIRKILQTLPKERQTLLFSATMPNDIRALAEQILTNPERVKIGESAPVSTVAHAIFPVPSHRKPDLLMKLLEHTDTESVLIFVRTKHRAERLAHQLSKKNYKVTSLQGNLSQRNRQSAMQGFRDGSYQIMVATDIAARGIDISSISHVINFDIPDTVEAYTHRIGRTGRAAKSGDAFTLVGPEDQVMVRSIERTLKTTLERRTIPDFNYKAPPQEYLQKGSARPQDSDRGERRDRRDRGERRDRRSFRSNSRNENDRNEGDQHARNDRSERSDRRDLNNQVRPERFQRPRQEQPVEREAVNSDQERSSNGFSREQGQDRSNSRGRSSFGRRRRPASRNKFRGGRNSGGGWRAEQRTAY